jgi:hypothetical protein
MARLRALGNTVILSPVTGDYVRPSGLIVTHRFFGTRFEKEGVVWKVEAVGPGAMVYRRYGDNAFQGHRKGAKKVFLKPDCEVGDYVLWQKTDGNRGFTETDSTELNEKGEPLYRAGWLVADAQDIRARWKKEEVQTCK